MRKNKGEELKHNKEVTAKSTLVGTIFDKYPEVKRISWHQHFDGPYFYVEPWSVHVNGKYVCSNNPFMPLAGDIKTVKGKPVTEQEHAAMIELEDLLILAAGGKKGAGSLDFRTETAINMGALLRAILGDGVIVTIYRNGFIKREQSNGSEWAKDDAEYYAKRKAEDRAEDAFKAHVLACGQCTSAIHEDEGRISRSYMCEAGRGLAEVVGEAGRKLAEGVEHKGDIDEERNLWFVIRDSDNETEEESEAADQQANGEISEEMDQKRRDYDNVDRRPMYNNSDVIHEFRDGERIFFNSKDFFNIRGVGYTSGFLELQTATNPPREIGTIKGMFPTAFDGGDLAIGNEGFIPVWMGDEIPDEILAERKPFPKKWLLQLDRARLAEGVPEQKMLDLYEAAFFIAREIGASGVISEWDEPAAENIFKTLAAKYNASIRQRQLTVGAKTANPHTVSIFDAIFTAKAAGA
jgi:hypothetical protein